MRTTVIPAQIITVEDLIAGNLSLSQIIILIVPLIFALISYIVFPPEMKLSLYKVALSCGIAIISLSLAVRIKEKIVMQWLLILLQYNLRPGYYLFNKNDTTQRIIDTPIITEHHGIKDDYQPKGEYRKTHSLAVADLIRFEKFIADPRIVLLFKTNKKGGVTIAINQVT